MPIWIILLFSLLAVEQAGAGHAQGLKRRRTSSPDLQTPPPIPLVARRRAPARRRTTALPATTATTTPSTTTTDSPTTSSLTTTITTTPVSRTTTLRTARPTRKPLTLIEQVADSVAHALGYLSRAHRGLIAPAAAFAKHPFFEVGYIASKLVREGDLGKFVTVKAVVDEMILAYVSETVFAGSDESPPIHDRMFDFLNFLHHLFLHAEVKDDTTRSNRYYNKALQLYRNVTDSDRYISPVSF